MGLGRLRLRRSVRCEAASGSRWGEDFEGISCPNGIGFRLARTVTGGISSPTSLTRHHRTEAGHHEGNVPLIGYDPGYVVVTRAAKKTLLDASRGLARLSTAPSLQPLEVEWRKVESTCASLGIKK